ncbi:hypothetical protein OLZ32_32680 [Rhizobium sp. 1AS11]|uniref:hypothetical protein n=1 Tax=Rhizobium acaciae TaxID=2989736 RepID=UPI002223106B|nr:hypothetical protein [Rhizobium acaciae]MCW1412972.1 hypothetical protein [Rhizobium acaciae]MCW1745124.1 hypothetical protein [Rhizobium acaciae]
MSDWITLTPITRQWRSREKENPRYIPRRTGRLMSELALRLTLPGCADSAFRPQNSVVFPVFINPTHGQTILAQIVAYSLAFQSANQALIGVEKGSPLAKCDTFMRCGSFDACLAVVILIVQILRCNITVLSCPCSCELPDDT